MADPNVGQRIAENWEAVVGDKPQDQVSNDYWLANRLKTGDAFVGLSGGDFIAVPLVYALNGTVSSYSDTDQIATTRSDIFDRAEYPWKEYAGTVVISELEKDRNAGTGTVFPILPAKLENLRVSMRSQYNADFYGDGTGNNSKAFTGLKNLVPDDPTTGTRGGISAASFAFWRSQQTSGAQTTSAFDNLRASMRTVYNNCSNGVADQHPTFAVTDQTSFQGYEGLLIANEQNTDKSVGDGGYRNEVLKFKGMLLSYDVNCPAGSMYFLNERFLKLVYKTGSWMKARPAVNPANQTIDVILIRTMANLIAIEPRRLGVVTGIS